MKPLLVIRAYFLTWIARAIGAPSGRACATISRHCSTGFVSSASPMSIKAGAVIVAAEMSQ